MNTNKIKGKARRKKKARDILLCNSNARNDTKSTKQDLKPQVNTASSKLQFQ